jgi:hypothetical protein
MTFKVPSRIRRTLIALAATTALLGLAASSASAKVQYGIGPQTNLNQNDYDLMNSIGTDLIRNPLFWAGVQPGGGDCTAQGDACNWAFPDSQVGAAAANGIETMFDLYGSAPFVNSDQAKPPVNNVAAWKQFVGAAAQRYGPGGAYWNGPYQGQFGANAPVIPVRVWQIWNEQSSFQFFQPKPNVKKYAKILVPGSEAILAADKKADVLLGGMFTDTGPKGIPIDKFLKDLYKAKGVKDKTFDGVAVHPYAEDVKELDDQVSGVRKTMDKSGGKKDDLWITEIGYASDGPKSQEVVKKGEKGQAKAITDAYKYLNKKDKKFDIPGIIYFTWQDAAASTGVCQFCVFAGLLDQQGNQKKAFGAYKKVTK